MTTTGRQSPGTQADAENEAAQVPVADRVQTADGRADGSVAVVPLPSVQTPLPDGDGVRVPILLSGAAAWCWRVVVILLAFYALYKLLAKLELLVLPTLVALLTTALLAPVTTRLRKAGLGRGVSTLVTVVLGLAILGSIGFYVSNRASADYPALAQSSSHAVTQLQNSLNGPPFHVDNQSLNNIGDTLTKQLDTHRGQVASGVISAGRTAIDVLTGVVLWLFLTIMFLLDGDRIFDWLVRLFPRRAEQQVRGAGWRAWRTLSGYISGQFLVALFHALAIGITLLVLRSPLVAPLAVLVFVGSFIPIIGALVFGAFAVVVTLVAGGAVKALVLLIVLVVENQIEGHVLQPFVVGRYVQLHPVAIAMTLTAGALLVGIPGAIFAVPLVASLNAAIKFLAGREDVEGNAVGTEEAVPSG